MTAILIAVAFVVGGAFGYWAGRQILLAQIHDRLEPEER